jgi:hypothetical protein
VCIDAQALDGSCRSVYSAIVRGTDGEPRSVDVSIEQLQDFLVRRMRERHIPFTTVRFR